jgi:hypothetical protein
MEIKVTADVKLVVGLPQVYPSYQVARVYDLPSLLPGAQLCAVITAYEDGLPQTYFLLGLGAASRPTVYGGFELRVAETASEEDDDVEGVSDAIPEATPETPAE